MPHKVIVIGAVALGPKAACRIKRLEPDAEVIMIDKGNLISYGGCGIPYYVSGDVSEPDQLQSTSFHMLRDKKFFLQAKDIDVRTNTEAVSIDRKNRTVLTKNLGSGEKSEISYDHLVIGTGSIPRRLDIPGTDLEGVYHVSGLDDAIKIKSDIAEGKVENAVVIGAGAIGLEMAEALSDLWGIETSVVEVTDQILPGIVSPNMARMGQSHMEQNDITFYLGQRVETIKGKGRVTQVVTDKSTLKADLVIVAVGVSPNSDLARNAGLEISPSGAIVVNKHLQTSDPLIYAGGDCVEITNLITGKPGYWPLGSLANRQGRVIGTNICGKKAQFDGAVGSFTVKLFDISIGCAGLSLQTAKKQGYDAVSAFVVQFDRAHFYPEKELLYLELVVEKNGSRVLGIQGFGGKESGVLSRVSAVAAMLRYGPTVSDIGTLELPYSPPFSSAMDVVNALGNTAENILAGRNRVIEMDDFYELWKSRGSDGTLFLDCRGWGNAQPFVEKYPECWKSVPQDELRDRMDEIPRDKQLILICNTGVRSFEAQITLDKEGIKDTYNLQGGIAALKKWGLDLP